MYNRWINNDELYHYGVKGMKWGVRKEIEQSGRRIKSSTSKLKNTGKRRFHKITSYYHNPDGTINKKRVAKTVAIGTAAVAGTVIAAGLIRGGGVAGIKKRMALDTNISIVDMNKDHRRQIKKGQSFNHVFSAPASDVKNAEYTKLGRMYVTYDKGDAGRYQFFLRTKGSGKKYVDHMQARSDLNIPTNRESNMIFRALATNPDIYNNLTYDGHARPLNGRKMSKKNSYQLARSMSYEIAKNPNGKVAKMITEGFRQRGYDAMPDFIDQNTLGKDPIIVLNTAILQHKGLEEVTKMKTMKNLMRMAIKG